MVEDAQGAVVAGEGAPVSARLARGTVLAFLMHGLNLGLGYLVQVALARWMGAAEFGRYALIFACVSLLAVPAGLGLPPLLIRFVPEYRARHAWGALRGLLRWSAGWIAVASLGVAAAATLVLAGAGPAAGVADPVPWLLGIWVLPLLSFSNWAMELSRALYRIAAAYLPGLVRHLVVLVGGLVLFRYGWALTSREAVLVTGAAYALLLVLQALLVPRFLPAAVRRAPAERDVRAWWGVGLPLLVGAGFGLLLSQTDLLLVGALLGPREAGLYRAASRTAGLVGTLLVVAGAVVGPHLPAHHAANDRARLQRLLKTAVAWAFWPALLMVGVLIAAAGPVLGLFGPGFEAVRGVLVVLALGQLANAGTGIATEALNLTGHQNAGVVVLGCAVVLNGLLIWAGIAWLGMLGAALATVCTTFLLNGTLAWTAYRRLGLDPSLLSLFRR